MRAALCILGLILLSPLAHACQCQTSFSACNELGASDLVFIGTVEFITPIFLSRWNASHYASLQSLNDAYLAAQEHPSEASLANLRSTYLKSFPDLTPDALHELQSASTVNAVTSLFYSSLNRGMRVHFKVRTLFKHAQDDDDPIDTGKDEEKSFDVWTPFGDCGLDFQAGETYLVYANNDESSGYFSATRCTRTRRLTDAGEDLAYLFFHKEQPKESSRLEGFTTTDQRYQLELSRMHDPETVKSPVPGLVVELQSDKLTRYAESDDKGHFIFEGLPEGDYKLSAFAAGYPKNPKLLAEPRPLHLEQGSCGLQVLLLPRN